MPLTKKKRLLRGAWRPHLRQGLLERGITFISRPSYVVSGFAMAGDIQSFAFVFLGHAQTDDQIAQLVGDESHDACPYDRGEAALQLKPDLAGDRIVRRYFVGNIIIDARATKRWRGKYAGQQCAQSAADAMHAE